MTTERVRHKHPGDSSHSFALSGRRTSHGAAAGQRAAEGELISELQIPAHR